MEQLESDLRDHLISSLQDNPNLDLDGLMKIGSGFMANDMLSGGYAQRMAAKAQDTHESLPQDTAQSATDVQTPIGASTTTETPSSETTTTQAPVTAQDAANAENASTPAVQVTQTPPESAQNANEGGAQLTSVTSPATTFSAAKPGTDSKQDWLSSWLSQPGVSLFDEPIVALKGESLAKVSKRTGIPIATLEEANPQFKGKKALPTGSRINALPSLTNQEILAMGPEAAGMLSYDVKPDGIETRKGENLFAVSQRTGIPIELLMHVNKINDPSGQYFPAGTIIRTPEQSMSEKARDWFDEKFHKPVIDVNVATRQLQDQALPDYDEQCAHFVYNAIDEGLKAQGKNPISRPASSLAKDGGEALEKVGYRKWASSLDGYMPKKGDVVVIGSCPGHPEGHMAMFDGEKWISDKAQTGKSGMWSNLAFRNSNASMAIYRP